MFSLSLVAAASGRSVSLRRGRVSSEPWEHPTTDFMDQYSADAEKAFHQDGRAAREMDAAAEKNDADDPFADVRKPIADVASTPSQSVSDAWLKQSSDSWAFMPRAKNLDDSAPVVSEEPRADAHAEHTEEPADTFELSPGTANFWKPKMDWQTELRSAQKQASDTWGMAPHKRSTESWEMAPRAAVHAEEPSAPIDVSQVPHISSDVSSSAWGAHLSSDASSGLSSAASSDTSSDASVDMSSKESSDAGAVKVHAGSLGGLFDGGEDRGSHKKRGSAGDNSEQASQQQSSSHAGGAVVDVRLDSELQESLGRL